MILERCQRSWYPTSATEAPSLRANPAFRLRRYWRLSLRDPFSGNRMSTARIPTKPSGSCNFFRLEELKDVAFLDVIIIFKEDATFVTFFDLTCIFLEPLEGRQLAGPDDGAIA